jgi:SAM-dependent methyltransferase
MTVRKKILDVLYREKFLRSILFNPVVEYHQWKLAKFVSQAASDTTAEQRLLDVGAGELKYKSYFTHCHYFSNDLCVGDADWNYGGIDIVSSVYEMPVDDASFDRVLCIQVLEHLDKPDKAFEEFHRVLTPGGRVYLSVPLIAGEHQQPYDYFRYTRYGLAALGERHGFEVISLASHGGSAIALETLFWGAFWERLPLRRQTASRYAFYVLLYPIKFLTGVLALFADFFDRKKSITINYDVVYEKV